jgi:hypothetical protein
MKLKLIGTLGILLTAFAALAQQAQSAQEGFGPLDTSQPTGITVPQIIESMGKRETAFAAARESYTFRQDVRFNAISDDTGRPDGEYHQITDITCDREGRRVEHVVFAPQNTVERVIMTTEDFKEIEHRLPFILTTAELPDYDITYLGKQHVDELDTYVFEVAPKQPYQKGRRYLKGKVWVDQQDKEIVLVNGISFPQDMRPGHEDLSPPYTTYYQQIDSNYWFPVYTRAEGVLHFAPQNGALSQDVHVKTIVKYSDYKQFHTSITIHYDGQDITNERQDQSKPTQPQTPPQPK